MSHCVTCECDDPSSVSNLNIRVKALLRKGLIKLKSPVSDTVRSRLSDCDTFQFGFREFLIAPDSNKLVGMFLCALKRPEKFYAILISKPSEVHNHKPFEYVKGSMFYTSDVKPFVREDWEIFSALSDNEMADWLNIPLAYLHAYVEKESVLDTDSPA